MLKEDHKFLIKKAKEEYRKIRYVECPAFCNERVYFNQKGFKHLIMKNGKYRTHFQQQRRLLLIPHILSIISSTKIINAHRNSFGIDFWSLSKIINNKLIIVVIKQAQQKKYFLSVMDKKLPKNAKTPEGVPYVCYQQSPD